MLSIRDAKCFKQDTDGGASVRPEHLIKSLGKFRKQLRAVIEQEGLPKPKIIFGNAEVFGCGFFGCVAPTTDPGVAFKITTDPAEAAFVQCMRSLSNDGSFLFPGIVKYLGVWTVPITDCVGRPVFVMWREEAVAVGLKDVMARYCSDRGFRTRSAFHGGMGCEDPDNPETLRVTSQSYRILHDALNDLKHNARAIRNQVLDARDRGDDLDEIKMLADVEAFPRALELMSQPGANISTVYAQMLKDLRAIGALDDTSILSVNLAIYQLMVDQLNQFEWGKVFAECFMTLYSANILLADVHTENIGAIASPTGEIGPSQLRVTDPGLFVPLTTGYDDITLPMLCGDNTQLGLFKGLDIPEGLPAGQRSRGTSRLLQEQREEVM